MAAVREERKFRLTAQGKEAKLGSVSGGEDSGNSCFLSLGGRRQHPLYVHRCTLLHRG